MRLYIRRITETFGVVFAISALSTLLLRIGIIPSYKIVIFTVILIDVILIALAFAYSLFAFWVTLPDAKLYYRVNLITYLLLAVFSFIVYFSGNKLVFTYLFLPYKLLTLLSCPSLISIAAVNVLFSLLIFLMPDFSMRRCSNY